MRRNRPLRRTPRQDRSVADRGAKAAFRAAATAQVVCAVCRLRGHHAHHVLYEQHLASEGEPLWTPANALLLCQGCHGDHHARSRIIRTSELTRENIGYVIATLGAFGVDYLRRYYDDSNHDERLLAAA